MLASQEISHNRMRFHSINEYRDRNYSFAFHHFNQIWNVLLLCDDVFAIEQHSHARGAIWSQDKLAQLCELFGKTRLAYYDRSRREDAQLADNLIVLELVSIIRSDMPRIGTQKLHFLLSPTLRREGIKMGRDKLHHLLHDHDLTVRRKRKYPNTTYSSHWLRKYPNLSFVIPYFNLSPGQASNRLIT